MNTTRTEEKMGELTKGTIRYYYYVLQLPLAEIARRLQISYREIGMALEG